MAVAEEKVGSDIYFIIEARLFLINQSCTVSFSEWGRLILKAPTIIRSRYSRLLWQGSNLSVCSCMTTSFQVPLIYWRDKRKGYVPVIQFSFRVLCFYTFSLFLLVTFWKKKKIQNRQLQWNVTYGNFYSLKLWINRKTNAIKIVGPVTLLSSSLNQHFAVVPINNRGSICCESSFYFSYSPDHFLKISLFF